MRIGSIVQKAVGTKIKMVESRHGIFFDDNGELPGGPKGTVIELIMVEDDGWEERLHEVVIRWEDGSVEQLEIFGLVDVTPCHYANLYLYDRAYGGPEEGGWWYNTYDPVGEWSDSETEPPKHGHFATEEEAQKAYETLLEWCEQENKGRRSPSSVISEGHFVVWLEAWPAEHQPTRRPYYC